MEPVALFLAGLGLFLTGVSGIRSNLQKVSLRRLQSTLAHLTDRRIRAGLMGVLVGAITQSDSAVAFIMSGLVASGAVKLKKALPVVAAANVGTAILVFVAAADLHVGVLYLIGVASLLISFRFARKQEAALGALLAIGLLFLGLDFMKRGMVPLPQSEWFHGLTHHLQPWLIPAFLLGTVLRACIQSSSAIAVVAVAIQASGLFTELQSMMIICGAGVGVAVAGFFMSGNLSGCARQIVLYQCLINAISGVMVASFIIVDHWAGLGILNALLPATGKPGNHLALIFLANMVICLFVGFAILPKIELWLAKLAPPSAVENLAQPQFIHPAALGVPQTAVTLVDREQQHYFVLCLTGLDTVRPEGDAAVRGQSEAYQAAALQLHGALQHFLEELLAHPMAPETMADALVLTRRQTILASIADGLHHLELLTLKFPADGPTNALFHRLVESVNTLSLTALEAWKNDDPQEREYLLKLTDDRGELMEKLRRSIQSNEQPMSNEEKSALFYATTLFERIVWLLHQFASTLDHSLAPA